MLEQELNDTPFLEEAPLKEEKLTSSLSSVFAAKSGKFLKKTV